MTVFDNETEGNAHLRDITFSVFCLAPKIEQEYIVQLPSPIQSPRINITNQYHLRNELVCCGREIEGSTR